MKPYTVQYCCEPHSEDIKKDKRDRGIKKNCDTFRPFKKSWRRRMKRIDPDEIDY